MDPQLRTQWTLWVSFLATLPIYAATAAYVRPEPADNWTTITVALLAVSFALTATALTQKIWMKGVPSTSNAFVLVRWALAEAVAINGLVAVWMGAPLTALGAFMGWSAFLLVLFRPRPATDT